MRVRAELAKRARNRLHRELNSVPLLGKATSTRPHPPTRGGTSRAPGTSMAPGSTPIPSSRPPNSGVHERPEPPSVPRSYLRSLEAVGREAVALARQATLLHRDMTVVIPSAQSGDHVAVFVHGL